ncbi:MAG: D-alanyl-D-alanine carboxypeptidase/D-alanyl-D-alanine-endopeptidase, partial [Pedobacter sp.]
MLKRFITLALLLVASLTHAQSPIQKLEQAYSRFLADSQAKYATVSICVLDANTGKTLFAKNENLGVSTASTLKTITSATAFAVLGKDFRYQTTIGYDGSISADGTLTGNLIIVGGGDPTLGSWRYSSSREGTVLS